MFCLVILQFPPSDIKCDIRGDREKHVMLRNSLVTREVPNYNEDGEHIFLEENLTSQLYLQVKSHYVFWFLFRTFFSHPIS